MDIESILKSIVEDPTKNKHLLEGLSIEELQDLEKKTNVFKRPDIEFKDDVNKALCSIINLREDYIYDFMLVGSIGYIYRCLKEYTPDDDDKTWREISRKEKDEIIVSDKPYTAEELLTKISILENMGKKLAKLDESRKDLEITSKIKPDDEKKLDDVINHINTLTYVITSELSELGIESDKKMIETKKVYDKRKKNKDIYKLYTNRKYTTPPEPGVFKVTEKKVFSIIQKFLDNQFKYNPDRHVQEASQQKISWYKNEQKRGYIEKLRNGTNNLNLIVDDLVKTPVEACHQEDYDYITSDRDFYKAALTILREESASFRQAIKHIIDDKETLTAFRNYMYDKDLLENKTIIENIPPEDVFSRCTNYMKCNREELRLITDAMRIVSPHIDTAMIVYTALNGTQAEVRQAINTFKQTTMIDINNDICELDMNKWTIVASSKKNTEVVEMYNRNEHVLASIIEKTQEDKKISKEMMKKGTMIKKAANIKKEGMDAENLNEYIDTKSHDMSSILDREITKYLNLTNGDVKKAQELKELKDKIETYCDLCEVKEERGLTTKEKKKYSYMYDEIKEALSTLDLPTDSIKTILFCTNSGMFDQFELQIKGEQK